MHEGRGHPAAAPGPGHLIPRPGAPGKGATSRIDMIIKNPGFFGGSRVRDLYTTAVAPPTAGTPISEGKAGLPLASAGRYRPIIVIMSGRHPRSSAWSEDDDGDARDFVGYRPGSRHAVDLGGLGLRPQR